jgi:Fe(3+) dicitrate transport protein
MKMSEATNPRLKAVGIWGALFLAVANPVFAGEAAPRQVETIIVSGSILKDRASLPGSSFEISAQDLVRLKPISVSDLFQHVPGIQVVSEDLFGLKVNISVRGLTPRRSARTLLLEDGMPIQPAPYSEPSAHYVPPFERIERIEILKGSGEILYGPQSLGGMINFITKPVTDRFVSQADLAIGTRNFLSSHLMLGAGNDRGGVALDLVSKRSDGIREGHATRLSDISLKASVFLSQSQTFTARFTHFVEDTALTEAGLDATRFAQNPYSNPFANDHFDLTRTALHLVHDAKWGQNSSLRTQIYSADTFRASYRQTDTSTDAMTANPATGCEGAARIDYERFASRCGNKMRPRQFYFAGLETTLATSSQLWGHKLTTIIGGRLHHEDADRRRYNGLTANARETSAGSVLRDRNLITTDATSLYALATLELNTFALSAGLRNEHIDTTNTSVVANFAWRDLTASTQQSLTLPGFGVTWKPRTSLEFFAGVHNGFAPPRPDRDVDPLAPANQVRPEESTNYEIGVRATIQPLTRFEATVFWLDFHELIVAGPLLGLASGTLVNAGKATHAGAEFFLRHSWLGAASTNIKPWLTVSLTHLAKAEFGSSVGEGAASVRGNRIPYAPKWLGDLSIGFDCPSGIGGTLSVHYVGEQFADARNTTMPSQDGTLGRLRAYSLVNLGLTFQPQAQDWQLYFSMHNVLDKRYLSTRTDGLFAGPPRQALVGIRLGL